MLQSCREVRQVEAAVERWARKRVFELQGSCDTPSHAELSGRGGWPVRAPRRVDPALVHGGELRLNNTRIRLDPRSTRPQGTHLLRRQEGGRRPSSTPSPQQQGPMSWQQVHAAAVALGQPPSTDQVNLLRSVLESFVQQNEDLRSVPLDDASGTDDMDALAAVLQRQDIASPVHLLLLKALKIAARRQHARQRCSQHVVAVLTSLLESSGRPPVDGSKQQQRWQVLEAALASEAASALGNLCYEPQNCTALTMVGGVLGLLQLLGRKGSGVEAWTNAAGALQTLSFQPDARAAVVKAGGPAKLLRMLASCNVKAALPADSTEARLQQRLSGVLHNVSSSADGISAIRQHGGIGTVVSLLISPQTGVAAAAAGVLHNMSRETAARSEMHKHPCLLPSLTDLLTSADTQVLCAGCKQRGGALSSPMGATADARSSTCLQAAVCAAGTLANLVAEAGDADRTGALAQAMAGALTGGAIHHSLDNGSRHDSAAHKQRMWQNMP